jgi:hypothetical protein
VPVPDASEDPEQDAADVLLADPPRGQRVTLANVRKMKPRGDERPNHFKSPFVAIGLQPSRCRRNP